jgi:preprotein translocase subunit SecA
MFKWLGGLADSNEKELRQLQPVVDRINELEPEFEKLSDAELHAKTDEFKARLNAGSSLDELLPEAFTAVREAAKRTIGQRHFDVQLMGGVVLHQGKIAEMKTGEGKTLVATLPLYLNSLTGRGCHLATVNDYLARRDPYWMGPIYHALGVSIASIYPQTSDEHTPARLYDPSYDSGKENDRWRHFRPIPRREAYQADITYGTSSEFGFDYLRDNMVTDLSQCVQRPLNYAIVDEVDYLLIDEARTPLIISGMAEKKEDIYKAVESVVSRLNFKVLAHEPATPQEKEEEAALEEQYDYIAYEKTRHIKETPRGLEKLAKAFGMKGEDFFSDKEKKGLTPEEAKRRNDILHISHQSMLAHALYKGDKEYVVKDGEVIIVDEFTGRLMFGRRYSEGLHQAIEAKERVKVQQESRTFATITIQNYFRMYKKLAGMTGTAVTEAEEFHKIYKLEVTVIPTHKPMIREDLPDQIYKDEKAKFRAVVREIEELHRQNHPVLVGTVSIENSENLSDKLTKRGIPHQVLNANPKRHEEEANIVAQAGQPGAVTVATNMAGRGVDIILGGNPEGRDPEEWQKAHEMMVSIGGLHVIGTERHEARRIDNQLRGRGGRQGDPGSSRFYVSLEDDVVRRFGGDRIKGFMEWVGMDEDTPIENKLVNRAIENAQVRVEGYHFDMRKHLVDYDDVVNKHREVIYGERRKLLSGADLKANILSMVKEEIQGIVAACTAGEQGNGWDVDGLVSEVSTILPLPPAINAATLPQMKPKEIEDRLTELAEALYEQREKELGSDNMKVVERLVMLHTIDSLWVEHLTAMENMREGIGLQAIGQRDPLVAYKTEGHNQFQNLLSAIQHGVAHTIYHVSIAKREAPPKAPPPAQVGGKKIGRNDPCPCGSGKKYKHCCGK